MIYPSDRLGMNGIRLTTAIRDSFVNINVGSRSGTWPASSGTDAFSHIEEQSRIARLCLSIVGTEGTDSLLPDGLRKAQLLAIVSIIPRGGDVKGNFTCYTAGQNPTTLIGNGIFAKVFQVFSLSSSLSTNPLTPLVMTTADQAIFSVSL